MAGFDQQALLAGASAACETGLRSGRTISRVGMNYIFRCGGERADMNTVQAAWEGKLEPVVPNLDASRTG